MKLTKEQKEIMKKQGWVDSGTDCQKVKGNQAKIYFKEVTYKYHKRKALGHERTAGAILCANGKVIECNEVVDEVPFTFESSFEVKQDGEWFYFKDKKIHIDNPAIFRQEIFHGCKV